MKIRILIKYYNVLQPGDAQCVFGQESDTTSDDSSHELQIRNDALEALRKIKHKELTEKFPKADMWCHFGTGIIQGPDEGNLQGNFSFFVFFFLFLFFFVVVVTVLLSISPLTFTMRSYSLHVCML